MKIYETRMNWQPVAVLSVIAGLVSCVGLINPIIPILVTPLGILSGIIAIRTGHRKTGWTGIILNALGLALFIWFMLEFSSH